METMETRKATEAKEANENGGQGQGNWAAESTLNEGKFKLHR